MIHGSNGDKAPSIPFVVLFLIGLVAIGLQIQIVVGRTEDYLGLRLNTADVPLAIAGMGILFSLLRKKSVWPRWKIPYGDIWIAGLTLVMVGAFFNGWLITGEWSEWALLNRLVGWFVLLGYIYGAAWAVTQYGVDVIAFFVRCSAVSFCFFQIIGFIVLFLQDVGGVTKPFWGIKEPFASFMGNRNAYALYEVAILSGSAFLASYSGDLRWKKFDGFFARLLWVMVPAFLMFNGSRAGMVSVALVIATLLFFMRGAVLRRYAIFFLLGWGLVFSYIAATGTSFFRDKQVEVTKQLLFSVGKSEEKEPQYSGDQLRIMTVTDALELWQKYPVLGAGLGTFFEYQKEKYGELVETIDCTPVWLLCETGAVGFMLFAVVFGLTGRAAWVTARSRPATYTAIHDAWVGRAGIAFLLGFCFMALFHQILFARILWVFMGFLLAARVHATSGKCCIA
jgi:hypothetical protein